MPTEQYEGSKPVNRPATYIPTLDSWRAFAIALVLSAHAFPSIVHSDAAEIFVVGRLGVQIFFALSGFLITSLLLSEETYFGSISLISFYRRRFFRIMPAAVVLLTVAGVCSICGIFNITFHRWLDTLFFSSNYSSAPPSYELGHFWSLAVEEHFYFLWPALIVFLPATKSRLSSALAICLALAIWRFISWKYQITTANNAKYWGRTDINGDAILWGAIVAIAASKKSLRIIFLHPLARIITPIALVAALYGILFPTGWKEDFTANQAFILGMPALILQCSAVSSSSFIFKILESGSLRLLGRISYSLYLWQQLFLTPHQESLVRTFPINIIVSIFVATISYLLIERPAIHLGHRIRFRRPSPTSSDHYHSILDQDRA